MTVPDNAIVIACAADQDYVRPLAVMLQSLLANLGTGRTARIHVLHGGIDDRDRAVLTELCARNRGTLLWVSAQDTRFAGAPLWGRMTVTTYYKLALSDLLSRDVRKVIWLDSDLAVLGDIARLWDEPIGERHALAVPDAVVRYVSSRCGIAGYRELGIPPRARYFNAGVMVIDLALWRRDRVSERALEYVRQYRDRVWFWDQEGLNAVLAGQWGELDSRWNHNASVPGGATPGGSVAGSSWIVHFAGNLKPWRYARHPQRDVYFRYLDMTSWQGWRPAWSLSSTMIGLYEKIGLRTMLYPVEHWAMRFLRVLSRRSVAEHP